MVAHRVATTMDLDDIDRLRERHPAWRLMRAHNAPLVLSFLGPYFVDENRAAVPASTIESSLDDYLYDLHRTDPDRYTNDASTYLDDWSAADAGWLRRHYPAGSDQVHYDATPALHKAYAWVEGMRARTFIGTESRLHTVIDLLRQIVHGAETDPETRIAELERRRAAIDTELADARNGIIRTLDETALRDRYQQAASTARELLADFREVEDNFRALDRSAREKIAQWEGGKGELLAELISSRADITASDQGRSFQAFYDFLLSEDSQTELAHMLDAVHRMPLIANDRRLRTVPHDWLDAAERTQHTVRTLSEQLRRFLDDHVWLENKRIMQLVRGIETAALAVRETPPADIGLTVNAPGVPISLPLERPLYDPQPETRVDSFVEPDTSDPADLETLLAQRYIDTARLADTVRELVPPRTSASLSDIIQQRPVQHGIAEILGYLSLDADDIAIRIDDETTTIPYDDSAGNPKIVRMRHVTVSRP